MKSFKPGDHVVYRKQKASPHPGPRAIDVSPSEHGEQYWYFVDKFWTVTRVVDAASVEVITRRGKRHQIRLDDPRVRPATLLQELLYRNRFPDPTQVQPEATVDVIG